MPECFASRASSFQQEANKYLRLTMIISSPLDARPACSHSQNVSFGALETHYYRLKHSQLCQTGKYGGLKWWKSFIPPAFMFSEVCILAASVLSFKAPLLKQKACYSTALWQTRTLDHVHTVGWIISHCKLGSQLRTLTALTRAAKCTTPVSIILFWQTNTSLMEYSILPNIKPSCSITESYV